MTDFGPNAIRPADDENDVAAIMGTGLRQPNRNHGLAAPNALPRGATGVHAEQHSSRDFVRKVGEILEHNHAHGIPMTAAQIQEWSEGVDALMKSGNERLKATGFRLRLDALKLNLERAKLQIERDAPAETHQHIHYVKVIKGVDPEAL